MKVLYYHQHFSTPKGATGTRSYEFSQKLIQMGHKVVMVCGSNWIADSGLKGDFKDGMRIGNVDGIKVIEFELPYSNSDNFKKRSIIFLKYAFNGIKIALKEKYDIIFATSTPLTSGIPGIFAHYLRKKPFIFEVRDLWPELPKKMGVIKNPIILGLMDLLETVSYKSAKACIGLSPGIIKGIEKKTPHKKTIMIPNGCDFIKYDIEQNVDNNMFTAVFTGAHGIANGLDKVLDAAKILIKNNIYNIEIQFIGDGALKHQLIKRSKDENIFNCKFLDPMPKQKLFSYLTNNCDVGLMILDNIPAFYYGTSPNKFFDYISLGLPVINNYPGWLADIIKKNNCGIVISPNDPEEFAKSLIKLKDKPKMLKQMGMNSATLAKSSFDRNKLSHQFVKFLESCI